MVFETGHTFGPSMLYPVYRSVDWSKKSGFKFSPSKTYYIIFTKRPVNRDPALFLCGSAINRKSYTTYLGVIFDQKLPWSRHILNLVERYKKTNRVNEDGSKKAMGRRS